jgi:hypothetical protein
MTKAHEIYMDVLSNLKAKATGDWGIYVLYQPLPPVYWKDSAKRGGNVLGLERFDGQVLCRKSLSRFSKYTNLPNLQYTSPISHGKEPTKTHSSRPLVQISSTEFVTMPRALVQATRTCIWTMQM